MHCRGDLSGFTSQSYLAFLVFSSKTKIEIIGIHTNFIYENICELCNWKFSWEVCYLFAENHWLIYITSLLHTDVHQENMILHNKMHLKVVSFSEIQ